MSIKKLAMTINSFEGAELAEGCLSNIRNDIDLIVAVWQKKSYSGNPMAEGDMEELQRLKKIGLIDELLEFESNDKTIATEFNRLKTGGFVKPDSSIIDYIKTYDADVRMQETAKRNMSIDYVKSKGYSHVLNTDLDEAYDSKQFKWAKEFINKNNYPITYCTYVNIYKDME